MPLPEGAAHNVLRLLTDNNDWLMYSSSLPAFIKEGPCSGSQSDPDPGNDSHMRTSCSQYVLSYPVDVIPTYWLDGLL